MGAVDPDPGRAVIKMIFFDAGGTILEPYPTFADAFTRICRSHGYEVTPQEVRAVFHNLGPDVGEVAEETGVLNATTSPEKSQVFWRHLYQRFLGALGIVDPALRDDLLATFSDKSSYKLFPEVLDAFAELRQMGYRLGLISNFEQWLEEVLLEEKAGGIFDVRVISGIEGVEKPDVEIYRLALSRAHAGASECVHVGDSITNDIEPAKAIGMKVVLIDRSDRFPGAAVPRITSLEELPRLIPAL